MKNLIKENNLELVRCALRQERTATKTRLGELTGISVVTIHSLLSTLMEQGEVTEDAVVRPQLGRPAASYRFNERSALALVISLYEPQVTNITYFDVIDLYGSCIWQFEKELGEITVDSFYPIIDEVKERYPQLKLIAFGVPGAVNRGKMVTSDYPGLRNVDLCAVLEEKYAVRVLVENDINAAVYGYCVSENCLKDQTVVGIYIPARYPPGAGICRNGEILKGSNGLAGEIKNLPVSIDGTLFTHGKTDSGKFTLFIIQVMMSVLNPDRIVLYQEPEYQDLSEKLRVRSEAMLGGQMEPLLASKSSMAQDFRTGMIHLALSEMLQRSGVRNAQKEGI